MAPLPSITFSKSADAAVPVVVVFVDAENRAGEAGAAVLSQLSAGFDRIAATAGFKGKFGAALDMLAPAGLEADRLVVVGTGSREGVGLAAALNLGGVVAGKLRDARVSGANVVFDVPGLEATPEAAAEFALGARLRAYDFAKYKTRRKDDAVPATLALTVVLEPAGKARKAWAETEATAEAVELARDLINEAPNHLGPLEFAAAAEKLKKLGLEVDVLDEKDMKKKGMGALLAVGQGSVRPPRLVVLQWKGGDEGKAPVAFIGKGVIFDSGGISIKPAASMEDMKGDMAGAAAVIGLMRLLAARKARVNAVGILGVVENLPDGGSYRPGDILTSMSGQTIEVINTDAEGRLVLADALWYCQDRFKPAFMIDLATLTGAIMVALGHNIAGLFANDDALAASLVKAGEATDERLWRMPMGPEYDKLIDSRFADMKNSGGRLAGSITAAQFLKRFVADTPWAHLDIAGTAMGSPDTEINRSWSAGFGVRLLDRLVRDAYEG